MCRGRKSVALLVSIPLVLLLAGCNAVLMDSKGYTGIAERNLIGIALGLMFLVVIPVFIMVFLFAWKYRAANRQADYDPEWAHSKKIEWTVWLVPMAIITVLASVTIVSTHALNPQKPIEGKYPEMTIEVISLDWKWLFIYPEQDIAVINEVYFPVDTPIKFQLTSQTVMNSFFIPQLGGQLYNMAGMDNLLYMLANELGVYDGISAHYSGAGFSGMKFKAHVVSPEAFSTWVQDVKINSDTPLDQQQYAKLVPPTMKHQIEYFSSVEPRLYRSVIEPFMGGMMGVGANNSRRH